MTKKLSGVLMFGTTGGAGGGDTTYIQGDTDMTIEVQKLDIYTNVEVEERTTEIIGPDVSGEIDYQDLDIDVDDIDITIDED